MRISAYYSSLLHVYHSGTPQILTIMKIELVANLAFTVVQEECLDQKLQQKPILLLQVFTVKIASSIKCLFSACEPATIHIYHG